MLSLAAASMGDTGQGLIASGWPRLSSRSLLGSKHGGRLLTLATTAEVQVISTAPKNWLGSVMWQNP